MSGYFEAGKKAIRSAAHDYDDTTGSESESDDDDDAASPDASFLQSNSTTQALKNTSIRRKSGVGSSSMDIENSESSLRRDASTNRTNRPTTRPAQATHPRPLAPHPLIQMVCLRRAHRLTISLATTIQSSTMVQMNKATASIAESDLPPAPR